MRIAARVTVLGCGTSSGVPMIGCTCRVCRSAHPRDQRLRPSIHLAASNGASLLVDTTPDLRQQALRADLSRVDAVVFTHAHADHILGLDDLRRFNMMQGAPMPCYADAGAWETIRHTFSYAFDGKPRLGGGVPQIDARVIDGPFTAAGLAVVPVPLMHGRMPILGFRFGAFAYLTDCNAIPAASWPLLEGVEVVIIDALRDRPHTTHFTVEEALAAARRIGPRQTYLTHMTHDLGYEETNARLPAGAELAYDGLVIEVGVDTA
jgi:phosphoribosyl 1,2-cyclic phosphate phosphodiesterase